MSKDDWFHIEVDAKELKRERENARKLRQSQWWKNLISKGICHYCQKEFAPAELTMDHVVPLARGGKSNKGNVVAACRKCNAEKKLITPAELLLKKNQKKHKDPL